MTTPNEHGQLDALLAETGWVLALARRLVPNPADAEDIAQSTLALAIEKRPEARGGLRPWLARVANRLAHRRVRSDVRRQSRETIASSARDLSVHADASASDEVAMRFELQREVATKVDALSEPYRRVLILRYFKGHSVSEIAMISKVPQSTVRSQLSRAIDRLREDYRQDEKRHRALALLVATASSNSKLTLNSTTEIILLKLSTKVAAVAVTALVAGVVFFMSNDDRDDELVVDSEATVASNEEPRGARRTANSVELEPQVEERGIMAPATSSEGEEVGALAPRAGGAVPAITTLTARVLGSGSMPLAGATLSSIYPDGRLRGGDSVSQADGDGRVVLKLSDDSVRRTRSDTLDMLFAISADDHAVSFVVKKLKLHGVNDLGDVRLSLGGTLAGICVDEEGNPVAGAVLYAGDGVVTGDPEVLAFIGPGVQDAMPRALSGSDGRFELAGIPATARSDGGASASLWAHARGCFWTIEGPIAISPAKRTEIGPVTLKRAAASHRVEGVVYQPDGSPAAGARVDYLTASMPPHGQVVADEVGAFVVLVKDEVPLELIARDAKGQFGMSPSQLAQRGEVVELNLTPRRIMSVYVFDTQGEPIHDVSIMPVLNTGAADVNQETRLVPGESWGSTDENGSVDLVVPSQRFSVAARNTDYNSKTLGPFTHDSAPSVLNITMPRARVLSGRVLVYGKPVAGATVAVTRRHRSFAAMTGGFPNRYPSGTHKYTTDSEGWFEAPLKKNWVSVGVVAQAEGLATGEVSYEISPGDEVHDVEVHLTEGGTIEGRVTPPAGVDVSTLHVAASRGDGHPISTRVDAKGRFRLSGLTPGDWRVEGRTREVRKEMLSISRHPLDLHPRWNAFVVDRKSLELDIDMSRLGEIQLEGTLLIDGVAPPPGWTAEILRPPHERGPTREEAQRVNRHGGFSLTARSGRAQLRLAGPLKDGGAAELLREIDLQGPQMRWEESLSTARFTESIDGGAQQVRFVRGADDEVERDVMTVLADEGGRLDVRVPVGRSRLQTRPVGSKTKTDWSTIKVVEIH